jgi:S-adenosylmethionine:tRNA ribosyltransferase-isomerase
LEAPYKNISIESYDYPLNTDRIAKYPLEKRDSSKVLIYKDKSISTSIFSSINKVVSSGDLLVFNNTRVVQARLIFIKETGANIEIFLLNPTNPIDYQQAFSSTQTCQWNCIVGNIKRWKGEVLGFGIPSLGISLEATMMDRTPDGALVKFLWEEKNIPFAQIIEQCGEVPIPPYLNRHPEAEDKNRYQTVYAKPEGSVAAPTAGLHFTDSVLKSLKDKGVAFVETTLHVGAGTFKPVKSQYIGSHEMHKERFCVTIPLIESILNTNGDVIAVGTTSLRTLESIYWLGVKLIEAKTPDLEQFVNQWEGYTLPQHYEPKKALNALIKHMVCNGIDSFWASTQMIIVPGYKFRVVDRLITNFHQPRSTLLLLVAAFIGEDWKNVYQYALDNSFRFLSYGDSSILSRDKD